METKVFSGPVVSKFDILSQTVMSVWVLTSCNVKNLFQYNSGCEAGRKTPNLTKLKINVGICMELKVPLSGLFHNFEQSIVI